MNDQGDLKLQIGHVLFIALGLPRNGPLPRRSAVLEALYQSDN